MHSWITMHHSALVVAFWWVLKPLMYICLSWPSLPVQLCTLLQWEWRRPTVTWVMVVVSVAVAGAGAGVVERSQAEIVHPRSTQWALAAITIIFWIWSRYVNKTCAMFVHGNLCDSSNFIHIISERTLYMLQCSSGFPYFVLLVCAFVCGISLHCWRPAPWCWMCCIQLTTHTLCHLATIHIACYVECILYLVCDHEQ